MHCCDLLLHQIFTPYKLMNWGAQSMSSSGDFRDVWLLCREMLVQWTTLDAKRPEARWGTKSGQYQYTAAAETDTYTRKARM